MSLINISLVHGKYLLAMKTKFSVCQRTVTNYRYGVSKSPPPPPFALLHSAKFRKRYILRHFEVEAVREGFLKELGMLYPFLGSAKVINASFVW